MKATLAITLSLLLMVESMLPAMELEELWKIPALLNHYAKHKATSPELDFFTFLELHYADADHHNQDHQAHHELPFTNHHNHQHTGALQAVFLTSTISRLIFLTPLGDVNTVIHVDPAPLICAATIWQPPKFA